MCCLASSKETTSSAASRKASSASRPYRGCADKQAITWLESAPQPRRFVEVFNNLRVQADIVAPSMLEVYSADPRAKQIVKRKLRT